MFSFSEPSTSSFSSTNSTIENMSVNKELAALVQRLEAVATRLEKTPSGDSNQIIEGKFLNTLGRVGPYQFGL